MSKTTDGILFKNSYKQITNALKNISAVDENTWLYSLLNNTIDCFSGKRMQVTIDIDETTLSYSHNGKYLSIEDIICMYLSFSSKTDDVLRNGKGLLNTHILSNKINIESILEDKNGCLKEIDFELNRSIESFADFTQNFDKLMENVKNTFEIESICNMSTIFTYNLSESSFETVKKTINLFENTISQYLAFNYKYINEFNICSKTYTINLIEKNNDVSIFECILSEFGKFKKREKVVIAENDNYLTSIGIIIKDKMCMQQDPYLFNDFTNQIKINFFPVHIYTRKFELDDKNVVVNKHRSIQVLQMCLGLFDRLISYLINSDYKDIYKIFYINNLYEHKLFKSIYNEFKDIIDNKSVIRLNNSNKLFSASDLLIPIDELNINVNRMINFMNCCDLMVPYYYNFDFIQYLYHNRTITIEELYEYFITNCQEIIESNYSKLKEFFLSLNGLYAALKSKGKPIKYTLNSEFKLIEIRKIVYISDVNEDILKIYKSIFGDTKFKNVLNKDIDHELLNIKSIDQATLVTKIINYVNQTKLTDIANELWCDELCDFIRKDNNNHFIEIADFEVRLRDANFKGEYENFRKFIDILKQKYNFKGLWHFTDFSNLQSIFQDKKLSSRIHCQNNKIKFLDGASHDVLGITSNDVKNKVRFYYRCSTPTLFANEGIKKELYCNSTHIPRPVYFLFDEELIYLTSTNFTDGNASASITKCNLNSFEDFSMIKWEFVFSYGPMMDDSIKNEMKRCRQAELLSSTSVNLNFLKKIIFRTEADLKQAQFHYGSNEKYEVDPSVFSKYDYVKEDKDKVNYLVDYDVICFNYETIINLQFLKNIEDYKLDLELLDTNGMNVTKHYTPYLISEFNGNSNIVKYQYNKLLNKGIVVNVYLNGIICMSKIL